MIWKPGSTYSHSNSRGSALVIALAFTVLLTGVAMAFLVRALTDRQISSSSSSQVKADLFTRGAIDQILGDLRQEIVAGSKVSAVGGSIPSPYQASSDSATGTIYRPSTVTS